MIGLPTLDTLVAALGTVELLSSIHVGGEQSGDQDVGHLRA